MYSMYDGSRLNRLRRKLCEFGTPCFFRMTRVRRVYLNSKNCYGHFFQKYVFDASADLFMSIYVDLLLNDSSL